MAHWIMDNLQRNEKPSPHLCGVITKLGHNYLELTTETGTVIRMTEGDPTGFKVGERYVLRQIH